MFVQNVRHKYLKTYLKSINLVLSFAEFVGRSTVCRKKKHHLQTSSMRRLRLCISIPSRWTWMSIWTNIWIRFRWHTNSIFPPAAGTALRGHLLLFSFLLRIEENGNIVIVILYFSFCFVNKSSIWIIFLIIGSGTEAVKKTLKV